MVKDSVKFLVDSMIKQDSKAEDEATRNNCSLTHRLAKFASTEEKDLSHSTKPNFCLC